MRRENIKANQYGTIIVNGYATPDLPAEMLDLWVDDLSYLSIYSYGFTMSGQLVSISDGRLIDEVYDEGVGPLMVLTPTNAGGTYQYELLTELFTNPSMRDEYINNVVLTVMDKNYYGVVFDFGFIAPEDREQFVITISKTAARLNRRAKLVIVSLTPGLSDDGIDYRSLGLAANSIELKTFYRNGEAPGEVASTDSIRSMLNDITTKIQPGKILLGLLNPQSDRALPYEDELSSSDSVAAKLELVNEYDLAGISIWTIMHPFPAGNELIQELFTVYKI